MAVVIRMMRAGAKKRPFYRIVVADSRRQRDGRFVEILGYYDPMTKPHVVKFNEAKAKEWIALGAQPSVQAASLFRKVGIIAAKPSKSTKKADAPAKRAKKTARRKPRPVTERRKKARVARVKKKAKAKAGKPAVAKKA